MNPSRLGIPAVAAVLLGLSAGHSATTVPPAPEASPRKSVYGKLDSVDPGQRALVMLSDDGDRLAWRVEADVIERLHEFKPGAPMIVIYRQTRPNEKTVTAVAFPGAAPNPTYVNTTDGRVVLHSGPQVDGSCDHAKAVNEIAILQGGQAETSDACWCCAPAGETCEPSTKTGLGKAFLVRCL